MLKINELARLYLGIQGENGVRSITVDVSAWINLYPNGSVTVWHKRCGDSTPSPTGAVYDSEEQTVTWDITSVDTFVAGIGEAEFRLIENEVIKKTAKVMTGVSPAVTLAGTELGSDWASYINAVDSLRAGAVVAQEAAEDAQEAAEDAKEAAEDAQEAAEAAQTAAETAQGKAEDAQTAAEEAAARAEHASKVMVPAGGTEGQRLAKKSGTDFDMEWKTDPYYTKPAGGIPASDMAEGVIPDPEDVIDDTAGEGDTDKTWSADKLTSDVLSAFNGILVEKEEGETATLTNLLNVSDFYTYITGAVGYAGVSLSSGIAKWKNYGSETSPYLYKSNAWGNKKWIVGFKYKLTKVDPNMGEPENVRIHLGQTAYDASLAWGEWVDFKQYASLDLTRIRFAVRNFASAPANNSFTVEIKDVYIYDVSAVSSDLYNEIMQKQSQNYTDGTVTYGEVVEGYYPDDSLTEQGKAADSKAVGDAFNRVCINVKRYGVKGDGTTDDTDAIKALFESRHGDFYFPAGTYKITGTITLPDDSSMFGDGDTTIINMASCDDLTACIFRGNDKIYPYILVDGDNTKLHDFKLTGNNTTANARHGGICMIDAEYCDIQRVTVYNINYYASQSDPDVSGYGISIIRSGYAMIDYCYVEQCGYECIGIVDSSHHCVVSNCVAKNGWRTCMQIHRGAHDVLFTHNEMIQSAQAWDALFTLHGVQADPVKNLRLENNVFKATVSPRERTLNYAAVVQLMSYCDGIWFVNNRVESGDRDLFSADTNSHLFIIGNLFQCNDASDYRLMIGTANVILAANVLENTEGTTQTIPASAVKIGNVGIS